MTAAQIIGVVALVALAFIIGGAYGKNMTMREIVSSKFITVDGELYGIAKINVVTEAEKDDGET